MAIMLAPEDRVSLREFLEQRFSLEELETLAFDLGVDYNQLPHSTSTQLSMELISYFERRGDLNSLITMVLSRRPDDYLTQLSTRLPSAAPLPWTNVMEQADSGSQSERLRRVEQKLEKPVLVIEDEANWQYLICNLLDEVAIERGWIIRPTIARSFVEALEQLNTGSFDFITIDNQLLDGENAKRILDLIFRRDRKITVIVVSGAVNPKDVRDFFKIYDVDEFFWKNTFDYTKFKRLVAERL